MVHLTNHCKAALLAVTILVSGNVVAMKTAESLVASVSPVTTLVPSAKQVMGITLIAMWIRLVAKGTKWDYKSADWNADVQEIIDAIKTMDSDLFNKVVNFFDKWAVGRKLVVNEKTIKEPMADGTIERRKDKYLKSSAFGAMGLFDAYVISMLERVGSIGSNLEKANAFTMKQFNINLNIF